MLSQTVEYALRAAVLLASNPGSSLTTDQISQRTQVPRGYLSKVLQQMGRAGLVHAKRGFHGGFALSRRAEEMTILEVINAVDSIPRIRECPLGLKTHGKRLCALHRRLDDASALIEQTFARTTLAEVLADPSKRQPLCEVTVKDKVAADV